MRHVSLLPLLALSLPAAAGTSIDPYLGAVGSAEISGEVEVPLLSMAAAPLVPVVAAKVNGADDKPMARFMLSSGDHILTVDDAFVAEHGLEPKEKKDKRVGELQYVEIESLEIGGLLLRDVRALVSSSKTSQTADYGSVQIGLGLLPGVAWAIQPSEGVVRFAPAASGGAALLERVGSAPIAYTTRESEIVKVGKDKERLPTWGMVVPAQVGGLELALKLDTASDGSWIKRMTAVDALREGLGGGPTAHKHGDVNRAWVPVAVGGQALGEAWVSATTSPDLSDLGLRPRSYLGANALGWFDIAANPATQQVALSAVEAPRRASSLPDQITAAQKLAEEAGAKAAEAAKESGEEPKPSTGAWMDLAHLQMHGGRYEDAVASYDTALAGDEASCAAHLGRAEALSALGKLDEAAAAADQASALYWTWWGDDIVRPGADPTAPGHPPRAPAKLVPRYDQAPLKNRKGQSIPALTRTWWGDWADKGNDLPDGLAKQPASCWTADTTRAQLALARGDGAGALEIYEQWVERYPPMRLVIDRELALVGASAQTVQGDLAAAVPFFRQAALADVQQDDARWALGLALHYAEAGQWDSAAPLFDKALHNAQGSTLVAQLYADAMVAALGDQSGLKGARALAERLPTTLGPAYAWAYAATASKVPGALDRARAHAAKVVQRAVYANPYDASVMANAARLHLMLGDRDAAIAAHKAAVALDPANPYVLFAGADLAGARGNGDRAMALRTRAAQAGADDPAFQALPATMVVDRPGVDTVPAPDGEAPGGEAPPATEAPAGDAPGGEAPPAPEAPAGKPPAGESPAGE